MLRQYPEQVILRLSIPIVATANTDEGNGVTRHEVTTLYRDKALLRHVLETQQTNAPAVIIFDRICEIIDATQKTLKTDWRIVLYIGSAMNAAGRLAGHERLGRKAHKLIVLVDHNLDAWVTDGEFGKFYSNTEEVCHDMFANIAPELGWRMEKGSGGKSGINAGSTRQQTYLLILSEPKDTAAAALTARKRGRDSGQ